MFIESEFYSEAKKSVLGNLLAPFSKCSLVSTYSIILFWNQIILNVYISKISKIYNVEILWFWFLVDLSSKKWNKSNAIRCLLVSFYKLLSGKDTILLQKNVWTCSTKSEVKFTIPSFEDLSKMTLPIITIQITHT